jgi:hypothetical protein
MTTNDKGKDFVSIIIRDPPLVNDTTTAEPSTVYKQPKLPRSFEMLRRTGIKIIDYQTSED